MGKKPISNETADTKKPIKLSPALLLPYIIDFVVAAVAFIVVLLATWGLHNLGNILGIGWFRFFWRIFELLAVSFGTLWCVVFVIAKFAKKTKRQLNIVKRFGEPWRIQPVSLVICSLIVLAFLYVGITFAEKIRDDSDDVSILACEMLCETGPDFIEPVDKHLIMLKDYAKYTGKKHFSILLKVFPKYSTKEILADANEILVSAKASQEEAANEIWRAGEKIMLGRLKALKLLPRGISLHEYRKAPEWLMNDIENALEESRKAAKTFDEKPTMENAVKLCMANKKTMLLIFLIRNSRQNQLFDDFQVIVEACRKRKIDVAGRIKEKDDPRKEFLLIISDSEQRRFDILDEIKKQNMQAAIERMWDAIELAYSRREKLLSLSEKIRNSDNYTEVIGS